MKIALDIDPLRRSRLLGVAASGLMIVGLFAGVARAQVITGTISGVVKDATGAVMPNTTVTAKQIETGLTRTAVTSATGDYTIAAIPIGHYEVSAEAPGFKKEIRSGIQLAVGETAVINMILEVGAVQQQVTVTGEAPVVNTTTSQTSGEVAPEQVKDLPLNGRSYDQLITLTTGVSNFTENDNRPSYSVAGKRGESNRFLINGVDLVGQNSSGQQSLPIGSTNSLLGVDAVQEFNVETDTYGAELGKRAGGQINIVTTSGTNQFHGDLFEFLRNTAANANGFFSTPATATTQKRNQYGGALGGPIVKDKVFFFGSYEGVRQITNTGTSSTIPDANALDGLLPNGTPVAGVNPGMLPIIQSAWPNPATYPGGCKEVAVTAGQPGECNLVGAPTVSIREDFGLTRFDYNISSKDSLATTYTYDNGTTLTEGLIPTAGSEAPLGMQLLSIQQTYIFSPELLNVATLGFSRAYANVSPAPYELSPITPQPIPSYDIFVPASGAPGQLSVGGGVSSGLASNEGPLTATRNLFTYADDVHYTKGRHDVSFGVWVQRVQSNDGGSATETAGGATFANLTTLLQGNVQTYMAVPSPTELGFRSTEYAGYLQDNVKLRHNLSVRVGLRIEGDNGWNEHTGRASFYNFNPDGVIDTNYTTGVSPLIRNNAAFLPEPRVGLAWDPFGTGKTSVRAAFGVYDDLQDNVGTQMLVDPPFNTRPTYSNMPFLSIVPTTAASILPQCETPVVLPQNVNTSCLVPYTVGVDPNLHVPTALEWSFSVEQQLSKNLVLHVGYSGFESYHNSVLADANQAMPVVCSNPAGCASGGVNIPGTTGEPTGTVPEGTTYIPLAVNPATGVADGCRLNCDLVDTQTLFFEGNSNYNSLNVYVQQRYSNGIAFRVNYTWEKIMDDFSELLGSEGANAPGDIYDFWNLAYDRGVAAYNITQQLNFNFDAALPFGKGRPWANNLRPVMDAILGGWQFNGIFTAQTGFPFTPLVGVEVDGSGNSHIIDRPNMNPANTGPLVNPGNVTHYYNDTAFTVPLAGTFGDESVGSFTGPGLVDLDLSLFKKFPIRENKSLELRFESFNLANHPNFGVPSQTAFAASGTSVVTSPTYGKISALNVPNRELQLGLKFIF